MKPAFWLFYSGISTALCCVALKEKSIKVDADRPKTQSDWTSDAPFRPELTDTIARRC
jgi:hypothetical protein